MYLRLTPLLNTLLSWAHYQRGKSIYGRGAIHFKTPPIAPIKRRGERFKRGAKPPLKTTSPFPSRGRGSGGFPGKSKIFLGAKGDGVNATEKRNMLICVANLSELAHLALAIR